MQRLTAVVVLVGLMLVGGTTPAWAQATGSIGGQVTDTSGSAAARRHDRSHEPGHRAGAHRDHRGRRLLHDPAGQPRASIRSRRRCTVSAPPIRDDITVVVNETARADLALQVGQLDGDR